jgi:hypothetical protein
MSAPVRLNVKLDLVQWKIRTEILDDCWRYIGIRSTFKNALTASDSQRPKLHIMQPPLFQFGVALVAGNGVKQPKRLTLLRNVFTTIGEKEIVEENRAESQIALRARKHPQIRFGEFGVFFHTDSRPIFVR